MTFRKKLLLAFSVMIVPLGIIGGLLFLLIVTWIPMNFCRSPDLPEPRRKSAVALTYYAILSLFPEEWSVSK